MPRHSQHPAVYGDLHPAVYWSIIALTIWLVFSVWLLFDYGSYSLLILIAITAFFVVAMAIPLVLAAVWRHNVPADEAHPAENLRQWLSCEFSTWSGPLSGKEAAMQILLPIAAVAIGMTIFGLVFYFDVPHLS
jgi:hypothetical protein